MLVGVLAALTLSDAIQLWMLYGFALLFGLADAFYFPANRRLCRKILDKDQLQSGNTIVQGTAQLSLFLARFWRVDRARRWDGQCQRRRAAQHDRDRRGFRDRCAVVSRIGRRAVADAAAPRRRTGRGSRSVIQDAAGMRYLWQNEALRFILILIVASNFFIMGPMDDRHSGAGEDDAGGRRGGLWHRDVGLRWGRTGGIILSGVLPRLKPARMGTILLTIQALMGVALALLAQHGNRLRGGHGAAHGRQRVREHFLLHMAAKTRARIPDGARDECDHVRVGRVNPVSTALAGVLIDWNLTAVFIGGGILMALVTLLSLTSRAVRDMGMQVAGEFHAVSVGDAVRATSKLKSAATATGEIPIIGGD